jgi:predicted small lipoprotein YifL
MKNRIILMSILLGVFSITACSKKAEQPAVEVAPAVEVIVPVETTESEAMVEEGAEMIEGMDAEVESMEGEAQDVMVESEEEARKKAEAEMNQ